MLIDWSDYTIFRSIDHDKGLWDILRHDSICVGGRSHLSGMDCRRAFVY